jgi:hypothetical protein
MCDALAWASSRVATTAARTRPPAAVQAVGQHGPAPDESEHVREQFSTADEAFLGLAIGEHKSGGGASFSSPPE